MRSVEKQRNLEEDIFLAVDELAEEFNLKITHYPHVYYLSRKASFSHLGLANSYREDFNMVRDGCWGAIFLEKPSCILLSSKKKDSFILEEVSHFVHFMSSGDKVYARSRKDIVFACYIKEMLGFFGSLVLGAERQNPFSSWPDFYGDPKVFADFVKEKNAFAYSQDKVILWGDNIIHHQGYSLGERLFFEYASGKITRKEIRSIFINPLSRKNDAGKLFFDLRSRLGWPIKIENPL